MKVQLYRPLSKKRLRCRCFSVNFAKFFKELFRRLLLHNHSLCCLMFYHNLLPFQKQCHTCLPAEYFIYLICRLDTRVSLIFETLGQKPEIYFQPSQTSAIEHFCENSYHLKAIKYFCKKVPLQMFGHVLNTPL